MAFLRSVATTTTAIAAASALPFALTSPFPSSFSASPLSLSKTLNFPFTFQSPIPTPDRLGLLRSFTRASSALHMDSPSPSLRFSSSQEDAVLPELLTEYMVDMKCDGCVNAVKNSLQTVEGVKNIEVDLANQVVRVLGTSSVKTMSGALEQTGQNSRLIGQGVPDDFLISAAVVEFKGPDVFGVVRLAQVSIELARVEANFSGLSPGKHGWSINEYGDLTNGAASTGNIFNPANQDTTNELLGDLGTLDVDEKGEAFFSGAKRMLRVAELIGRSIVVYKTEDKSDSGITAAVIARSAGVGENYKKLCTCDGTTIWESTNNDFIDSKV